MSKTVSKMSGKTVQHTATRKSVSAKESKPKPVNPGEPTGPDEVPALAGMNVPAKLEELEKLIVEAQGLAVGDRSPASYEREMDALNKAIALVGEIRSGAVL